MVITVTITIEELGNSRLAFCVFNRQMQVIKRKKGLKQDRRKITDRLAREYMRQGESVHVSDNTVH